MMELSIKNMVCNRCIMVVRQEFEKAGLVPIDVNMGQVILKNLPSEKQLKKISLQLNQLGFEILDDKIKN